jgi:hypothetical protein
MSEEKDFQRLDSLLADVFHQGTTEAPPGFQARVMARIGEVAQRDFVWDMLRVAAKPLLVSGWAAAAILAVVALKGLGQGQDIALAALMNGDTLSRWIVL